jgi:hypothetical protein
MNCTRRDIREIRRPIAHVIDEAARERRRSARAARASRVCHLSDKYLRHTLHGSEARAPSYMLWVIRVYESAH